LRRPVARPIRVLPDPQRRAGADSVAGREWDDGDVVDLDELALHWRTAFRAARDALGAAEGLPEDERRARLHGLAAEVDETQSLLRALAPRGRRGIPPLVVSQADARRLLGLPPEIAACVFNLDGVLIGSAALHVAAWAVAFDELIVNRVERTGGRFAPFDPHVDYIAHIHARPRLDGVRAFLESRGIRLPEGDLSDAPGTETVHGLANRKNQALRRALDEHGVHAFDGSYAYLELAHEAGVRCAVVSASANTEMILQRAGLSALVDERVDGETIREEHLRPKPAPDMLLAACRKLGVEPLRAATFETTGAGIVAARAAGFDVVIGVDGALGADRRELLRREGADTVVSGIDEFLEHRLAA
jgi:beta-phosphoglucomutase family hydrolase